MPVSLLVEPRRAAPLPKDSLRTSGEHLHTEGPTATRA